MLYTGKRHGSVPTLMRALLVCVALVAAATAASAQRETQARASAPGATNAGAKMSAATSDGDEPPFHEYKGVRIGMSADEARKKLGSPQDKSPQQDFFTFSDKEMVQVFYDAHEKVSALAVTFLGDKSGAPSAQSVFGSTIQADAKGSVYKLERFPKAGYWLSYTRTAGDAPMTVVTIKRIE